MTSNGPQFRSWSVDGKDGESMLVWRVENVYCAGCGDDDDDCDGTLDDDPR